MLYTSGRQFRDWSGDYRLFEKGRFNPDRLFTPALRRTLAALGEDQDIVAHLDDTRCRRWGKKVSGASWHRDPLGPHFRTNFLWANRFLQISLSLPEGAAPCGARAIPVDLQHCPCQRKPKPKDSPEAWKEWKEIRKRQRLPRIAAERLSKLREGLDKIEAAKNRRLVVSVDGGLTNTTFFAGTPDNIAKIGRIRKDAKLYALPQDSNPRGRPRIYGEQLPTPQAIRADENHPWTQERAWAAGREHVFKIKTLSQVRWRGAGKQNLRLVIVAPLHYRLSKESRILYHDPAYLICTDPDLPLEKLIQDFVWRWGIEVNFRDEKTLLGMGEAQVWTPTSVALVPAFIAAAYACLQLAVHETYGEKGKCPLPNPKWQRRKTEERITTPQMIKMLRGELWGRSLGVRSFSDFANQTNCDMKWEKRPTHLKSAVFYAIR